MRQFLCAWGIALPLLVGQAHAATPAVAPDVVSSELRVPPARSLTGYYPVEDQEPVRFTAYAPPDVGNYDAIILLHGYQRDDSHWSLHQLALAERGWISVAINYDEKDSQQEQLAQIRTAIERMWAYPEVRSVSICGTSWGGKMAFETIAKMPELAISTAFLVYPTLPVVTDEEISAIRADILDCVGAVDRLSPVSRLIEEKVRACNDQIAYKLHIYSGIDFPLDAQHGYFFASHPQQVNAVAADSFVRWISLMSWKLGRANAPKWKSDPTVLLEEHLLDFDDL